MNAFSSCSEAVLQVPPMCLYFKKLVLKNKRQPATQKCFISQRASVSINVKVSTWVYKSSYFGNVGHMLIILSEKKQAVLTLISLKDIIKTHWILDRQEAHSPLLCTPPCLVCHPIHIWGKKSNFLKHCQKYQKVNFNKLLFIQLPTQT